MVNRVAVTVEHYTPEDPLRAVDIYTPPDVQPTTPLMVFVHGGAWVSEDKADHADLGMAWAKLGMVVAIPNYKLSPRKYTKESIVHPSHCNDIAESIIYLEQTVGKGRQIYLSGHSAGAHIIMMLLIDPSYSILPLIKGAVGIDGIYDIKLLLRTFPSYISFITAAFGDDDEKYAECSPALIPVAFNIPPVLIVHSLEDTLVDYAQAQVMYDHLRPFAKVDIDISIKGDHAIMLKTPQLASLIATFINAKE